MNASLIDPWDIFTPIIEEVKRTVDAIDYDATKAAAADLLQALAKRSRVSVSEKAKDLLAGAAWDTECMRDYLASESRPQVHLIEAMLESIGFIIGLAEKEESSRG